MENEKGLFAAYASALLLAISFSGPALDVSSDLGWVLVSTPLGLLHRSFTDFSTLAYLSGQSTSAPGSPAQVVFAVLLSVSGLLYLLRRSDSLEVNLL